MSKKKGYRDLKDEIIELKNVLDVRNGRIAVLSLAVASKDDKIQEYKEMIKSLEYKIRIVSDAVSEPTKRKTFKIPLRTETKYEKQAAYNQHNSYGVACENINAGEFIVMDELGNCKKVLTQTIDDELYKITRSVIIDTIINPILKECLDDPEKCSCGKDATVKYYGKFWCDDCFDEIK